MQKYLIVGLGNKGETYKNTRHNIGFLVADALAQKHELPFKASHFGQMAQGKYKGRPLFILKPDTYMNLSGNAVVYWAKKEKIALENILVITDDLHLDFGAFRIKGKGSHGGHNGLRHIEQVLQSSKYPRFRFGVGNAFEKGNQVDYVLGEWTAEESSHFNTRIPQATNAIEAFIFNGIQQAMNRFNGKLDEPSH